jgi:hypothetical protein
MGTSHLGSTYITQRLKDRLSEIGSYPITTVIAPMGYGNNRHQMVVNTPNEKQ